MSYMVCPECGELLRHKQIIYEDEMVKVCNEMNIDYYKASETGAERLEAYVKKRQEIVNKLCDNYCCKFNLITSISVVRLVK